MEVFFYMCGKVHYGKQMYTECWNIVTGTHQISYSCGVPMRVEIHIKEAVQQAVSRRSYVEYAEKSIQEAMRIMLRDFVREQEGLGEVLDLECQCGSNSDRHSNWCPISSLDKTSTT